MLEIIVFVLFCVRPSVLFFNDAPTSLVFQRQLTAFSNDGDLYVLGLSSNKELQLAWHDPFQGLEPIARIMFPVSQPKLDTIQKHPFLPYLVGINYDHQKAIIIPTDKAKALRTVSLPEKFSKMVWVDFETVIVETISTSDHLTYAKLYQSRLSLEKEDIELADLGIEFFSFSTLGDEAISFHDDNLAPMVPGFQWSASGNSIWMLLNGNRVLQKELTSNGIKLVKEHMFEEGYWHRLVMDSGKHLYLVRQELLSASITPLSKDHNLLPGVMVPGEFIHLTSELIFFAVQSNEAYQLQVATWQPGPLR